jgi:hypothetical protein
MEYGEHCNECNVLQKQGFRFSNTLLFKTHIWNLSETCGKCGKWTGTSKISAHISILTDCLMPLILSNRAINPRRWSVYWCHVVSKTGKKSIIHTNRVILFPLLMQWYWTCNGTWGLKGLSELGIYTYSKLVERPGRMINTYYRGKYLYLYKVKREIQNKVRKRQPWIRAVKYFLEGKQIYSAIWILCTKIG